MSFKQPTETLEEMKLRITRELSLSQRYFIAHRYSTVAMKVNTTKYHTLKTLGKLQITHGDK